MDLMDRQAIRLDRVRFVVLDEADQMLDIGFRPAVESILEACPSPRQTLLLSATMPKEVRDLTRRYMVDPVDVRLIHEDEDATIPAIKQSFVMVSNERKLELLFRLIDREQPQRAIVFCRTKHGADKVGALLKNEGLRAEAMHGDLSQGQRNRVLSAFRSGRLTTLVATDVVGRGIDVPGISHVINFDIPEDPEHYVHRIGRTGRMGKDGAAFTFVLPDQGKLLDQIEKAISRKVEQDSVDGVPTMSRPMTMQPRRPQGGPRGRRFGGPRRGGNGGGQGSVPVGNGIKRRRFGPPQRTS
jgi:ATP-dependent RNA helicase DeaD